VTSPSEPTSPFTPGARETLAAAGLDLSRVAYARQVHGADVAHALTRGGVAGAVDVLSTTARGMPLAIFSADCLAVTLWDAEAGVDPARIENPRLCTACHPELLYSYRKGNRGRLVTVAALP